MSRVILVSRLKRNLELEELGEILKDYEIGDIVPEPIGEHASFYDELF